MTARRGTRFALTKGYGAALTRSCADQELR